MSEFNDKEFVGQINTEEKHAFVNSIGNEIMNIRISLRNIEGMIDRMLSDKKKEESGE